MTVRDHQQGRFVPINGQLAAQGGGRKWLSIRHDLQQQFST